MIMKEKKENDYLEAMSLCGQMLSMNHELLNLTDEMVNTDQDRALEALFHSEASENADSIKRHCKEVQKLLERQMVMLRNAYEYFLEIQVMYGPEPFSDDVDRSGYE